ncbi:MAG: hypothetical protein GPJ52_11650 [Candidatus Heimdallarchaeota archaeon]|nr:hypothetical protein [Candidatus Heimdallarchaeota archaeon]
MSSYAQKQLDTILLLALPLLLAFGIGSLVEAYRTALIVLTILASAFFGWLITWGFKFLMDIFFDIRDDQDGKPRISGRFTKVDFQKIYSALRYLITATVATIINFYYNEGIEIWAQNYGLTAAPKWLGSLAIVSSCLILAYLMGWLSKRRGTITPT